MNTNLRYPTLFVNHGGGPLPLMGEFPSLVQHWKEISSLFVPPERPVPSAIVLISAHWESDDYYYHHSTQETQATQHGPTPKHGQPSVRISSHPQPPMLFDYYGFPPETYEYNYPAPGSPSLARHIQSLLRQHGIHSTLDPHRGLDHGVFIPLMYMFPKANIPVVCVSLHSSLDAEFHIHLGEALSSLRLTTTSFSSQNTNTQLDENPDGPPLTNILVLGSGFTFHNMKAFVHPNSQYIQASVQFNQWLKDTMILADPKVRKETLLQWKNAPGAILCHPREEHLLPLLVVAGAAGTLGIPQIIYDTSDSSTNSNNNNNNRNQKDPSQCETTSTRDIDYDTSGYLFL